MNKLSLIDEKLQVILLDLYKKLSSTRVLYKLSITLLLITLCLYIYLSFFNHPHNDEYFYANMLKSNSYDFINSQLAAYNGWTGRITANIAMQLPAVFFSLVTISKVTPIVGIILFLVAIYLLLSTITNGVMNVTERVLITLIIFTFYINQLPEISQSWFWPAAWFNHQLPIIIGIFLINFLIKYYRDSKVSDLLISVVLIFFTSGGNELIALNIVTSILLVIAYHKSQHNKMLYSWLGLLIVSLVPMLIMVSSPGNSIRLQVQSEYGEFFNSGNNWIILTTIITDFFEVLAKWIFNVHGILAFSLIFIIVSIAYKRNSKFLKNSNRILRVSPIIILSIVLILSLVNLSIFVILAGEPTYPRVMSLQISMLILASIYSLLYFANKSAESIVSKYFSLRSFLVILVLLATISSTNFTYAWNDIVTGRAQNYDRDMRSAYEQIGQCVDENTVDCVIYRSYESYKYPESLFEVYLGDENVYMNQVMSEYYGLDSIVMLDNW